VVRATHGALVSGDLAVPIAGVSIDSRTVGVSDAFFAIRGPRLDGHAFVEDAAGRGAGCLVVHALPDDVGDTVPLVLVEDTTLALGKLAGWHRGRFRVPVVAVTGSHGKTTTKELTASVLATRWRTLRSPGGHNNQWGLSPALLRLTAAHEAAVVELGTREPGRAPALAAIARPTVAVVTRMLDAPTEFYHSAGEFRDDMAAVVRGVGADGHVVLDADDPAVVALAGETEAAVVTYGTSAAARVRAAALDDAPGEGLGLTLAVDGERRDVKLALAGRHQAANALAAAAVGVALGLGLDEIARGLEAVWPLAGRATWRTAGGVRILDDTCSADPASMAAALATAASARRAGRRLVLALGDMLELGPSTADAHRALGRRVAALAPEELVVVGRQAPLVLEAARAGGLSGGQHAATFEDTVAHLLKRVVPGDVVLVKGSRGLRMERVVDALVARLARTETGSRTA
jgi:UDP-N-acetylmuramoyl-tripeptide--D-alanyl-D-alanine ligase